jgi:hypothetical protein
MWYGCEVNSLPHCCGFMEAGYFSEKDSKNKYLDFCQESPEALLWRILDHAEGRPVIFNFVKKALLVCDDDDCYDDEGEPTGEFEEEFKCQPLMDFVKVHAKVIDIGTHINPGTYNMIHSFIIKDYLQ